METKTQNIALIGMGNIMFHDEGLGTYLVKYLEANYTVPSNLTLVDGGVLGFKLMTFYQEYDKVLIIGINSREGAPGTLYRYNAEEMMAMGKTRQTANEVELTMMLEICSFHEEMGEVDFLTMIPQDIIEVEVGLTQEMMDHFPQLLEATVAKLQEEGITLTPKPMTVSLKTIIENCANPETPRLSEL